MIFDSYKGWFWRCRWCGEQSNDRASTHVGATISLWWHQHRTCTFKKEFTK